MADALSRPDPRIWRTRPRAPMPGTRLGPLDDIRDGDAKEYVFGRGTTVFSMFVVRRGGMVYGSSDAQGGYVRDDPVSPERFGATLFQTLGVPPETRLGADGFTRPASAGEPIRELFG